MPLLTLDWSVAETVGKFSVNHWRLTSCNLRNAGGWFVGFIHFAVVYSLEWDSRPEPKNQESSRRFFKNLQEESS